MTDGLGTTNSSSILTTETLGYLFPTQWPGSKLAVAESDFVSRKARVSFRA